MRSDTPYRFWKESQIGQKIEDSPPDPETGAAKMCVRLRSSEASIMLSQTTYKLETEGESGKLCS